MQLFFHMWLMNFPDGELRDLKGIVHTKITFYHHLKSTKLCQTCIFYGTQKDILAIVLFTMLF